MWKGLGRGFRRKQSKKSKPSLIVRRRFVVTEVEDYFSPTAADRSGLVEAG